jgi:hypothetical protein
MAGAILSLRETKPERGQERKPGKVKFEVFPVWTLIHKADILLKHTGVTQADKPRTEDCYFRKKPWNCTGERQLLIFRRVGIADKQNKL